MYCIAVNDPSNISVVEIPSAPPPSSGSGIFVSITDFGAVGDGVTDDAAAINAAIDSVSASGGGTIYMPTGVFAVGSAITLKGYVILQGNGFDRTTIRAMAGTSHDVVETEGFASLTGTNTPAGPRCFGLRNLSIDGNKANRSGTGTCLRIYGYDYELTNVEIYGSRGIGLYSEWCISGNVPVTPFGKDTMEAHIKGLRTFSNTTDGIVFNGPHDTIFRDILTFINGRYGATFNQGAAYTAGGTMLDQFHSYGNSNTGLIISTMLFIGMVESEWNTSGGGIKLNAPGGNVTGGCLLAWGNAGAGVEFNSPGSSTTVVAHNNTGDGVHVFSANNQLNVSSYSNGTDGVVFGSSATENTLTPCRVTDNTGKGVYLQGNDNRITGFYAANNGGGGIVVQTGASGLRIDGEARNNAGVQASLGTLAAPAIIDLILRTGAGQTAWSGNVGANYTRIATGTL